MVSWRVSEARNTIFRIGVGFGLYVTIVLPTSSPTPPHRHQENRKDGHIRANDFASTIVPERLHTSSNHSSLRPTDGLTLLKNCQQHASLDVLLNNLFRVKTAVSAGGDTTKFSLFPDTKPEDDKQANGSSDTSRVTDAGNNDLQLKRDFQLDATAPVFVPSSFFAELSGPESDKNDDHASLSVNASLSHGVASLDTSSFLSTSAWGPGAHGQKKTTTGATTTENPATVVDQHPDQQADLAVNLLDLSSALTVDVNVDVNVEDLPAATATTGARPEQASSSREKELEQQNAQLRAHLAAVSAAATPAFDPTSPAFYAALEAARATGAPGSVLGGLCPSSLPSLSANGGMFGTGNMSSSGTAAYAAQLAEATEQLYNAAYGGGTLPFGGGNATTFGSSAGSFGGFGMNGSCWDPAGSAASQMDWTTYAYLAACAGVDWTNPNAVWMNG